LKKCTDCGHEQGAQPPCGRRGSEELGQGPAERDTISGKTREELHAEAAESHLHRLTLADVEWLMARCGTVRQPSMTIVTNAALASRLRSAGLPVYDRALRVDCARAWLAGRRHGI
jgi:hypothetical protein